MTTPAVKPRIHILNATCLDAIQQNPGMLGDFADRADIIADDAVRMMDAPSLEAAVTGADAIVVNASVPTFPDANAMNRLASLKVVSLASSGHDHIDVVAATRCGILVTNAPTPVGAEVVADHTLGMMLAVSRQVPFHHQSLAEGRGVRGVGQCLWGKTLGIIGLGQIGRAVARRAAAFDMRILATTTGSNRAYAAEHGIELVSLDVLLRASDFVSLHVRLNLDTQRMIGQAELQKMKPTAYLINCARRDLVDQAALFDALRSGRIAGAGLDDPPEDRQAAPYNHASFVTTPHLGNRAIEGMTDVLRQAIENVLEASTGRLPRFTLNPGVADSPGFRLSAAFGRTVQA